MYFIRAKLSTEKELKINGISTSAESAVVIKMQRGLTRHSIKTKSVFKKWIAVESELIF